MIGVERGTVRLAEYDPAWKRLFEAEAARLRSVVGDQVAIEHVGSTAIDGMAAKPIIDILLVADETPPEEPWIALLEDCGYTFRPTDPVPDRRFFVRGPERNRTHYLSVTERGSETHVDQLLFRDYLRANPDEAEAYERLKRTLAARYPNDRSSYTDRKSRFVRRVLRDARRESDPSAFDRDRHCGR